MSAFKTISRRTVISRFAAGGVAAGVAPLRPIFGRRAWAQAGLPKRLLPAYWSGGTAFGNYLPTGTETNCAMSTQMKALEPYKQKITVFANIRRSQDNSKGSH